ncbi:MAG: ABC-F type ribosomal protection protein [Clostridia bacterium]|nr:ABC-F type ribosomal protection protein [Clostridia bacterium]
MSLIQIQNLNFAYGGSLTPVFESVNLQIDTNWKLGFIGRNGRGKTTFLRLLLGELEFTGQITASVQFDYFPFEIRQPGHLTREIISELSPDAAGWQFERELNLLAVDLSVLDRPFVQLSKGEQTKILLACLFLKDNHFLLIDEPTNHLDQLAREKVSTYLARKKGFIVVSHDRAFLDDCIDHVLSINRTSMELQTGTFSSWWENRQRLEKAERTANERLQQGIDHLSTAARRTSHWSDKLEQTKYGGRPDNSMVDRGYIGHKAAKMMKQAKVIEARQHKAIQEKSRLLRDVEAQHPLKIHPLQHHARQLIQLEGVSIVYGSRTVCHDIQFTIHPGDRVALNGPNGSGKSSLLKLILGEDILFSGTLLRASQLILSYVPQDASGLSGHLRVFCQERGIDESLCKAILNKLDFAKEQFEKPLESYSSGQKKKVLLAASLCEQAHLYVWDEPLNDIDILSRIQIEELLLTFQPTILFVEHDRLFCDHLATKTVELSGIR